MIKILIQHNNISVFKRIIENLTYYNIRLCMFVMLIEETNHIEFIEYLFCKLTKNVMNNVVQENMFHTVQTIMNTCINKINLLKQNRIPLLKWCIKQETDFHKTNYSRILINNLSDYYKDLSLFENKQEEEKQAPTMVYEATKAAEALKAENARMEANIKQLQGIIITLKLNKK